MGLFSKKVDYDELYRKLSSEKMAPEEARKAEKELKKLAKSGDKRGVIWRPLTSVQIQSVGSVNWATSEFEEAEHKYGICEEYVRVRSLPIVFNLFNESYEKYNDPKGAVFVARAYEHGWGVEKNHGKAVEIIRETENYPKDGTFFVNSDLIKNAYKEITGNEFPDSESSEQKEKQAISDAAKTQNKQPQSDINLKRVEYDGGDVYEGEILNGKHHGHGTYTWSDGSFYDGEWKDGKKDGNGKQSHPDGSCYDGGWKDDKMDGFGVLVYSNQSRYEGHWSEGNENGHGMLTFANGNSYDGEWKDGNENGHGIMKYINVGVYDGEWKDGDENGHGTMTYANGDRYDGEWKDGYENGHGMLTFANGNSYDGDWVNGEMNGNGIYTYANGEKYKVTCKEDEIISKEPFETPKTSSTVIRSNQKAKTEYKQIRYDSGDVYEGETQNGKRHGKGKYTWADGDTYEGDWKDGKRCGRGKVIQYGKSPSGETYMKYSYDGEWLDSKEHGHGICVEGDFGWEKMDKVFEGEWVNGKRQGRFVWYFTNSKGGRYIDFYEDGKWIDGCIPYDESIKTVGDAKRFREAEKRTRVSNVKTDFRFAKRLDMDIVASVGYYDGDYMNGERNGYGECAYDNGDKYIGTWKDGAANGVGRYAFARGGFYFGQFLNGRVDGYGVYFDGNDYHIGIFKNGECVTERDLVFEIGSEGKWLPLGFESDKSAQIYGDPNKPSAAIMKSSEGVEYSSTARMWLARFNGNLMVMGKILQKGGPINDQNGVFIHMDGLVATGEIRNSMLNGRVTIRYITGETVEVDCADNKPIEAYHTWDKFGREVW